MALVTDETVSSVIGGFYDAAYGNASWSDALAGLASLFDGSRAWLFHNRPNKVEGHTSVVDEGFETIEAKHAILRDPFHAVCNSLAPGAVVLHSEMIDMQAFRKRELWQDWLRPRDLYFGMQSMLRADSHNRFSLDVNRAPAQGNFTQDDKNLFRLILPHASRSGEVSLALGAAWPDAVGVAMLVVDRSLRVVHLNEAAEALIAGCGHEVTLAGSRLRVSDPQVARRLATLVGGCTASPADRGGVMLVPQDEGERSRLVFSVAPTPRGEAFGFRGEPLATIFLRPAFGGGDAALDDLLVSTFRLSPAHARLARTLASGMDLRQAAAERGISYQSARTYLGQIFRQTGTSRQPELVALLKTMETLASASGR